MTLPAYPNNIPDEPGLLYRGHVNEALDGIITDFASAILPPSPIANQVCYLTADSKFYKRTPSNDGWITIGEWTGGALSLYHRGTVLDALATTKHNLAGGADPTTGDDTADGYSAGSIWLVPSTGATWVCRDAANPAQWVRLTLNTTGVTPGTYGKVTVDTYGRVTAGEDDNALFRGGTYTTTSGTSKTWSNIPTLSERVEITLSKVSTDGPNNLGIRLGDSGGIETTGYDSRVYDWDGTGPSTATDLFLITRNQTSSRLVTARVVLVREYDEDWVCWGDAWYDNGARYVIGPSFKTLSGQITQAQLLIDGSGTFDAGHTSLIAI